MQVAGTPSLSVEQSAIGACGARQQMGRQLQQMEKTTAQFRSVASGQTALHTLWKYRYPPKSSSAPSPDRTIFTPSALILRVMRNIGVEARMVVMS